MARLLANWKRQHFSKHKSISSIFSETWKTCEVYKFEKNGYLGTNMQCGQTCLSFCYFAQVEHDHQKKKLYNPDLEYCNPIPIESIM